MNSKLNYDNLLTATKQPISYDRKFIDGWYMNDMTFADGSHVLIAIMPASMIFVTDTDWDGLKCLIDNDCIDEYESYDLVDGCAYFMNSDYALLIIESLIDMTSNFMLAGPEAEEMAEKRRQRLIEAAQKLNADEFKEKINDLI